MPLDETLDGLDELVASNDHFEFFWFPHTTTALTRRFQRLPGDAELNPDEHARQASRRQDRDQHGFGALLRVGTRFLACAGDHPVRDRRGVVPGASPISPPNVFTSDRDGTFPTRVSTPSRGPRS